MKVTKLSLVMCALLMCSPVVAEAQAVQPSAPDQLVGLKDRVKKLEDRVKKLEDRVKKLESDFTLLNKTVGSHDVDLGKISSEIRYLKIKIQHASDMINHESPRPWYSVKVKNGEYITAIDGNQPIKRDYITKPDPGKWSFTKIDYKCDFGIGDVVIFYDGDKHTDIHNNSYSEVFSLSNKPNAYITGIYSNTGKILHLALRNDTGSDCFFVVNAPRFGPWGSDSNLFPR